MYPQRRKEHGRAEEHHQRAGGPLDPSPHVGQLGLIVAPHLQEEGRPVGRKETERAHRVHKLNAPTAYTSANASSMRYGARASVSPRYMRASASHSRTR